MPQCTLTWHNSKGKKIKFINIKKTQIDKMYLFIITCMIYHKYICLYEKKKRRQGKKKKREILDQGHHGGLKENRVFRKLK
jgi:hypothetical protein